LLRVAVALQAILSVSGKGIQTDSLQSAVYDSTNLSGEIDAEIDAWDEVVEDIIDGLAMTRSIHNILSDLDTELVLITKALTSVLIIPYITVQAKKIRNQIKLLHGPVQRQRKVAKRIEGQSKKLRQKIKKTILDKIQIVQDKMSAIINKQNDGLTVIAEFKEAVRIAPQSKYDGLDALMDLASEKCIGPVRKFDQTQQGLLSTLRNARSNAASVLSAIEEVGKVADDVKKVEDSLKFKRPLLKIDKVLRHQVKVCIIWCKKFSLMDIINRKMRGVGKLLKLFDKAKEAILSPLLSKLNLEIKIPQIAGFEHIENLGAVMTKFSDQIDLVDNTITRDLSKLNSSIKDMEKEFGEFRRLQEQVSPKPTPVVIPDYYNNPPSKGPGRCGPYEICLDDPYLWNY